MHDVDERLVCEQQQNGSGARVQAPRSEGKRGPEAFPVSRVFENDAATAFGCSRNLVRAVAGQEDAPTATTGLGETGGATDERLAVDTFQELRASEAARFTRCQHDRINIGSCGSIFIHGRTLHLRLLRNVCFSCPARQDAAKAGNGDLHLIRSIEDARLLEGTEVGLSDWTVIDQNRIDQFAEATADYQWIHVDTERASREMPDGKTIAHGYLTLALIPGLTGNFVQIEKLTRAINFGVNKVRFYTPVRVGERVRARAKVLQARRRAGALLLTSEVSIEVEGARKPACVAETLGMYFFEGA
jgi:acyl dehydratase